MRASISACIRSQIAYPYGRMTMVPRTGPFSASCALDSTSWYQRGKSSAWAVSTFAIGDGSYRPVRARPAHVRVGGEGDDDEADGADAGYGSSGAVTGLSTAA